MGTSGAPVIQSLSLHTPMKNDRWHLGLMAQFMQYGFTRSTGIYADYAYHIRVGNGKVSFGLKAGADISNTDYTGILLTNPGDPVFTSNEIHIFFRMSVQEFIISVIRYLQVSRFRHFSVTERHDKALFRHIIALKNMILYLLQEDL